MGLVKINALTARQVASITDHTFLKTEDAFTKDELGAVRGRQNALQWFLTRAQEVKPYAICVRPYDVNQAKFALESTGMYGITIASVVGFPFADAYLPLTGQTPKRAIDEIICAKRDGAHEVDFVLPTKEFTWKHVEFYTKSINEVAKSFNLTTKLILETGENSDERIIQACKLAESIGVDFVKTSTGYSLTGATTKALGLMTDNFSRGIKISGGVTRDNYKELLQAASRRTDGQIDLNPRSIRIGSSNLLPVLYSNTISEPKSY